jgi:hypothetical protein
VCLPPPPIYLDALAQPGSILLLLLQTTIFIEEETDNVTLQSPPFVFSRRNICFFAFANNFLPAQSLGVTGCD